ncbi:hypothetical protein B0H13DRAFT_2507252 [Mycena leptocephala]|nr:hypothetical protein B0H13DRAFT_2507252 [Mycena leptocephala]
MSPTGHWSTGIRTTSIGEDKHQGPATSLALRRTPTRKRRPDDGLKSMLTRLKRETPKKPTTVEIPRAKKDMLAGQVCNKPATRTHKRLQERLGNGGTVVAQRRSDLQMHPIFRRLPRRHPRTLEIPTPVRQQAASCDDDLAKFVEWKRDTASLTEWFRMSGPGWYGEVLGWRLPVCASTYPWGCGMSVERRIKCYFHAIPDLHLLAHHGAGAQTSAKKRYPQLHALISPKNEEEIVVRERMVHLILSPDRNLGSPGRDALGQGSLGRSDSEIKTMGTFNLREQFGWSKVEQCRAARTAWPHRDNSGDPTNEL